MPKINRLVSSAPDFQARLSALCALPDNAQTIAATQKIIAAVRQDGDDALLELTERFDGHRPSLASALEVSQKAINDSLAAISRPLRDALEESASRLRRYHHHQITTSWQYTDEYGNILGERVSPLARAAVYVPGGKASYPSSALMGLIPAKVAAVNEVILSTPAPLGKIPAVTLAAAAIGGADRVFMLSGAQAVAAFALGTKSVPRADVIVGPGNAYVAEAKRQLAGTAVFDAPAGPSEVVIISDDSVNAEWVAADMMAQAEHDEMAQSIVISPDKAHLQAVKESLTRLLPNTPRANIIRRSLEVRGALILAHNLTDCCRIADDIAAEHVQVMCANAQEIADNIRNAGGIFIGKHSCAPLGDYCAGPNHVLPTAGAARMFSPLGTGVFYKRTGILEAGAQGAEPLVNIATQIAEAEGLLAHAQAARLRLK